MTSALVSVHASNDGTASNGRARPSIEISRVLASQFAVLACTCFVALLSPSYAHPAVDEPKAVPCSAISGTYRNTGPIVEGPTRRLQTGIHWRVFDGAVKDYPGLNGKIDAVRLEVVDANSMRVTAIDVDGTRTGPYLLGSRTPWRCVGEAFVNEKDSEMGGEGNLGDIHDRTSISIDGSGALIFETVTSIQRRTAFLLGGKIGKPDVQRRLFVFQRMP